jgi:hypothetical protein
MCLFSTIAVCAPVHFRCQLLVFPREHIRAHAYAEPRTDRRTRKRWLLTKHRRHHHFRSECRRRSRSAVHFTTRKTRKSHFSLPRKQSTRRSRHKATLKRTFRFDLSLVFARFRSICSAVSLSLSLSLSRLVLVVSQKRPKSQRKCSKETHFPLIV